MKRVSWILACAILATSGSAMAAKYGMAGCGLGSIVFKDKPGKIQIVAWLLNGAGSQTSAVTTGSSNCVEDASDAAIYKYIKLNEQALKRDISQGQGETLAGLLNIWKCDNQGAIGSELQGHYGEIYKDSALTPYDFGKNIKQVLTTKDYALACRGLKG